MDPISNLIVSLKNAGDAGRETITVSYSKVKENILKVLKAEGFIKDYSKGTSKGHPALNITLVLDGRTPKVQGVKRISKTSKRLYKKSAELRPVKQGYGALVISTPKGIMSGRDAKKGKLGGEILFTIW
ncbi:30S ribosomal protein S8 [Candidatus Parcubacteria bacterium]|nr:30S ribosomal protein S8 [Candidatus Parcubacteria bacterium]